MIAIILSFNRRKESSLEEYSSISLLSLCGSQGTRVRPRGPGAAGNHPWRDIYRTGSCPLFELKFVSLRIYLPRKEVIQPHLPVRLPCYDFTPVMKPTVDAVLLAVKQTSSGEPHSHGVTGGVYKTRERIHRGILIRDY